VQKPLRKHTSQTLKIALVLCACLLLAALAQILGGIDETARVTGMDLSTALINLFSAGCLIWAAVRSRTRSRRLARVWTLIALAQICLTAGDAIWAVLELGLGVSPFPSIADAFYLAYYPLLVAGLLLLPTHRPNRDEAIQKMLDMAILIVSSILVSWNFLIRPLLAATPAQESLAIHVLTVAYPTGDLLILWTLIVLMYNQVHSQRETPLLLLTLGAVVMVITDTIFSMQSAAGTYASGGMLDMGWLIAYLATGLAGVAQALDRDEPLVMRLSGLWQRSLPRTASVMPYLWISAAFLLLVGSYFASASSRFVWLAVGVGCCIAMIIIRQMITLRENRRLLSERDHALDRVRQQAAALARSNQELSQEIAERKRVEEQLMRGALYDSLTGLPNRILLMDRIQRAMSRAGRSPDSTFVLLLVDLDHFKMVNDSLGHLQGDQVLVEAAHRFSQMVRASDTVARLGADEFALLLEETDERGAAAAIRRVHELHHQPFLLDGHQIVMTASIGVVTQTGQYTAPEEVLRDANIARSHAKALGKGQSMIFNSEMRAMAINRLHIEDELRQAIANEEFRVFYQPIFSLASDRLIGFEALIRWDHPARGLLLPNDFITVAEESGLILPIGSWMLHHACQQMSQWERQSSSFRNLTVNVNISSKQLVQDGFVEQVEDILQQSGLPPACLQMEITESVLIDSHARTKAIFSRLRSLGVRIQIDDFGTGYSSLSYLQHFPIQGVKIDASFLIDTDGQRKNIELLSTIVTMAHNLGMSATAEGVETHEQLTLLKSLACPNAQGYLLGRPMDAAAVERYCFTSPKPPAPAAPHAITVMQHTEPVHLPGIPAPITRPAA
jgi:diguanylate cyclase (GGDEF)-like protein